MKLAAHITYFHSPSRKKYLKEVIDALLNLNCETDIYLYTNSRQPEFDGKLNIKVLVFPYRSYKISRFPKCRILEAFKLKFLIHPFYLAWENRKVVEEVIEDYDVQLYLEDDIEFKQNNLDYWLKYKDIALTNNYNLGFLRIEKDEVQNQYLTDVNWPLTKVLEIKNQKFLLNDLNPYCGFWIYDREELKKFVKTKEWKFQFDSYGIREKSAVGQHGKTSNYFKGTIIPLIILNSKLVTPGSSSVHHLPNNYIGKGQYCTQRFPIKL